MVRYFDQVVRESADGKKKKEKVAPLSINLDEGENPTDAAKNQKRKHFPAKHKDEKKGPSGQHAGVNLPPIKRVGKKVFMTHEKRPDGSEYMRKRTKTRSRQKNLKKDTRLHLKPASGESKQVEK